MRRPTICYLMPTDSLAQGARAFGPVDRILLYKAAIAFLVIIVIVLVFVHFNSYSTLYRDFMYGYWIASDDYCEQADISSMMLFIGDEDDKKGRRTAYLIINNDITNQMLTLDMSRPSHPMSPSSMSTKCTVRTKIEFEEDCGIPLELTFEFDLLDGTLKLHDGETMYGMLYKNHEISNVVM